MDESETNTKTTEKCVNAVAMRIVLYDYRPTYKKYTFFLTQHVCATNCMLPTATNLRICRPY